MRWLLAGYCGLVLISISALNHALQITQRPRFYGMKIGSSVSIHCQFLESKQPGRVEWYKADRYNSEKKTRFKIEISDKVDIHTWNLTDTRLQIKKLRKDDSGVYFCKINDEWGTGTELQVARTIKHSDAQHRTNMKDGLIVLQGLLLAVCIASIMLRKRKLSEKSDSIYEEPETDHIYEGLAIETCDGGLYEELSAYAQAEGAEAPWE